MTTQELVAQIRKKNSFLVVGLDTDLEKIPQHLLKEEDPIFAFNKAIIDATHHLCVAYKPNLAFYESAGPKGLISLEKKWSPARLRRCLNSMVIRKIDSDSLSG